MAIESATFLRRLARIVTLVLIAGLLECVSAVAQTPVMVGSVLGNSNTSGEFGQIYKIVVAKNGSVLFLDTQNGALYELQPGATAPIEITGRVSYHVDSDRVGVQFVFRGGGGVGRLRELIRRICAA